MWWAFEVGEILDMEVVGGLIEEVLPRYYSCLVWLGVASCLVSVRKPVRGCGIRAPTSPRVISRPRTCVVPPPLSDAYGNDVMSRCDWLHCNNYMYNCIRDWAFAWLGCIREWNLHTSE